ncbi:uncharacterized protein LOC117169409 [Belonocnema kinseyi]|uniref:uncharacterized protein LOC117169409 n=1 Tax=Belonocnema kinseyi TaxID=2817044 RepID=UPI00143D430B|nr:uncharacterized protein LOC117169409 [Belonocnema kinseyi]
MTLRRCIMLLSLLAWFTQARAYVVNCEIHPYHSQCRGVQTKRFAVEPGQNLHDTGFKDLKSSNDEFNGSPYSRLWTTLLENGLSTDDIYDVYASSSASARGNKQNSRKNSIKDRLRLRRIPIRDFLSDLELVDSEY